MKAIFKFTFCLLAMVLLASCGKDNLDTLELGPEEDITEKILCNLSVAIERDAAGRLAPQITGGTAPFTYSWSTGETTELIDGLVDGTYELKITDTEGCEATAIFELIMTDPCTALNASILYDEVNHTLTIIPSGGTAPYVYTWASGESTDQITVVANGDYIGTVCDAMGCKVSLNYVVIDIDFCHGLAVEMLYHDGIATLSALPSGGTMPYEYYWSNGSPAQSISVPDVGIYTVTITDAEGCEVTDNYEVTDNSSCAGFSLSFVYDEIASTLTANPIGGTAPYYYMWDNGVGVSTIDVVSGGIYEIELKDSADCEVTASYHIP